MCGLGGVGGDVETEEGGVVFEGRDNGVPLVGVEGNHVAVRVFKDYGHVVCQSREHLVHHRRHSGVRRLRVRAEEEHPHLVLLCTPYFDDDILFPRPRQESFSLHLVVCGVCGGVGGEGWDCESQRDSGSESESYEREMMRNFASRTDR